jgi:hypothetical protein
VIASVFQQPSQHPSPSYSIYQPFLTFNDDGSRRNDGYERILPLPSTYREFHYYCQQCSVRGFCGSCMQCLAVLSDHQKRLSRSQKFPKRFPHKRRLQHVSNARPAIVELRKLPECRFAGMLDVICVELRYTVLSQIRSDKSASIIP